MLIIRKKDNRISLSIVYLTTIILGIIAILLSYFIIKMVSTFTDLIVFIYQLYPTFIKPYIFKYKNTL